MRLDEAKIQKIPKKTMDAITFISKSLRIGDKVRLTLGTADKPGKPRPCFFGGYKTFGRINDIEGSVFPVFYRIGKNGQMVRRPIDHFHTTTFCLSDILAVERIVTPYRHLGYFNNPEDCQNLGIHGHEAALKAFLGGTGTFHKVDNDEVFEDIENDGQTRILDGGKYAVQIIDCPADFTGDPKNYPGYIDIFERITTP